MFVEYKKNAMVNFAFFLRIDQIDKFNQFHNLTNTFLY